MAACRSQNMNGASGRQDQVMWNDTKGKVIPLQAQFGLEGG